VAVDLGKTTFYQILDFNGEGAFGKVATCIDLNTSETVAIKIHKVEADGWLPNLSPVLPEVSSP
uniref:Protein kinase domain-containing protein n=1 Tax=Echeneis naucrates TaxID=173247 RepID=A0A665WE46_ECHNA